MSRMTTARGLQLAAVSPLGLATIDAVRGTPPTFATTPDDVLAGVRRSMIWSADTLEAISVAPVGLIDTWHVSEDEHSSSGVTPGVVQPDADKVHSW